MAWHRLKKQKTVELEKLDMIQMVECFIDLYNLGGFKFSPTKARPEIQEFIDKYPYLIEEIKGE
jgi:hypothetical protein